MMLCERPYLLHMYLSLSLSRGPSTTICTATRPKKQSLLPHYYCNFPNMSHFFSVFNNSLRQMDLELMRRLHKKVNIVIVITKADTLTQTEVKRLKANILRDVEANGIQLYKFPECDSDEDDDFKRQDAEMKASIPFAVVGSNQIFDVGGKKFRGRQYPWGVVDGS